MTIGGQSDLFYIALSYGVTGVVLGAVVVHSVCAWLAARRAAKGGAS